VENPANKRAGADATPTLRNHRPVLSDSVKRHLLIGYGADLTPVATAKEAGASWNARGMKEIACKLECAVDFASRKEYGGMASGRTPGRIARHIEGRAAEINWYSGKVRQTSRLSAWRTHEKSRIFGGHGCGLGAGRRPVTGYRPETGSWSAPPGP